MLNVFLFFLFGVLFNLFRCCELVFCFFLLLWVWFEKILIFCWNFVFIIFINMIVVVWWWCMLYWRSFLILVKIVLMLLGGNKILLLIFWMLMLCFEERYFIFIFIKKVSNVYVIVRIKMKYFFLECSVDV